MASKASMLKQGVSKTGKGLFQGMTPISSEENKEKAQPVAQSPSKAVKKEEAPIPEPVVEKAVDKAIEEPVAPAPEKVYVQPVEEKPVEKEIPVQEIVERIPVQPVEPQVEEEPVKKPAKGEKNQSRYEKDKFLLLDIRGLRDYVEHMAKAANMSATKYIRSLIMQDMNKNMDIYQAHKALEERLKGRNM